MRYNTPKSPLDNIRHFLLSGGIPVTLILLALSIGTFLATFFTNHALDNFYAHDLMFSSYSAIHAPWTFFTYPLVSYQFSLWTVVLWVFLFLSAGSLERSWGSTRFTGFFFGITGISALSLFIGTLIQHQPLMPINDIFLPLTGLIVAFCMLNPEQTLTLYFFPVRAKYVAIIVTAYTYIEYSQILGLGPLLGIFSLGGILASFLIVRYGRSWSDIGSYAGSTRTIPRGPDLRLDTRPRRTMDGSPYRRSPLDFAGRWRDWQERKRLERLWKNSGFSDTEPEWRDDEGRRRR